MVRAFIAIPCPDELKNGILNIQKSVVKLGRMKLVERGNIHMTLKFLGEVGDNKIDELINALGFISENESFAISLKGIGAFPGRGYIRVLWVGVDGGSDKISEIQEGIDRKLSSMGFEKDNRFHPHFTIARVRSIDLKRVGEFLTKNSDLGLGKFTVRGIDLMGSKLSPDGPTYSVIHSFELH
jgi:2'-5' RNA ligase